MGIYRRRNSVLLVVSLGHLCGDIQKAEQRPAGGEYLLPVEGYTEGRTALYWRCFYVACGRIYIEDGTALYWR